MIRVMSGDYINKKSKYKHYVLGCCVICRHIQVYKVTDDILEENNWEIVKCKKCEGFCSICILSKYQKAPGFARKCRKCDFRYTCATIRIKEMSPISIFTTTVIFEAEDIKEEV